MNREEYQQTQEQLLLLAGMVNRLDLPEMIRAIERSEAAAPVVDPTLWLKGSRQLGLVKRLALAANKLREEVRNQIQEEKARAEKLPPAQKAATLRAMKENGLI